MIEISSVSDGNFLSETPSADWTPPQLEKVGKVAFCAFFSLGAIVLISGNSRKRTISLTATASMPAPPPIEISEPSPPPSGKQMPISPLSSLPLIRTSAPPPLTTAAPETPPREEPERILQPLPPPPQREQAPSLNLIAAQRSAFGIPYSALRWTSEDQRKIGEIITTMGRYHLGEVTFFQFISNTSKFRQYEKDMDSTVVESTPLHPFKFLETIFGNPSLKKYMRGIFEDFFLRTGFMSGVNKGMNREAPRNNLEPYIEPFARKVGVSPEEIKPLIRDRAWEKLVRCLIEAGGAHEERRSQA